MATVRGAARETGRGRRRRRCMRGGAAMGDGEGRRGDGRREEAGPAASGQRWRRAVTTSGRGGTASGRRVGGRATTAMVRQGGSLAASRRGNEKLNEKFTSPAYIDEALVPVRGANRDQCPL